MQTEGLSQHICCQHCESRGLQIFGCALFGIQRGLSSGEAAADAEVTVIMRPLKF